MKKPKSHLKRLAEATKYEQSRERLVAKQIIRHAMWETPERVELAKKKLKLLDTLRLLNANL